MISKVKILKKVELLKKSSPVRQWLYNFLSSWKASEWLFHIIDRLITKLVTLSKDQQQEAYATLQNKISFQEEGFDEDEFLKQLDEIV